MIILPAIDLKDGTCVRLIQGEYDTAQKVAEDPVATAKGFEHDGAVWMHVVDLDGAKAKKPVNQEVILNIVRNTGLQVEVGGGIRDMETVDFYLKNGVARVILGSAALNSPDFVREAVQKYGEQVAVSIDARNGKVAADGWTETTEVDYLDMAAEMEKAGVQNIIFTDIARDGTMNGPNLDMLDRLNYAFSFHIIASGGVSSLKDIINLTNLNLYGAICGKALYSGALDLKSAITVAGLVEESAARRQKMPTLERFFQKSGLIPAIVQEEGTNEVLMLAYMNRESLKLTIETGRTWFYSRSRHELWNKGATSGHYQDVVSITADCDNDTLLVKVRQTGPACHTGAHSCFFREIQKRTL